MSAKFERRSIAQPNDLDIVIWDSRGSKFCPFSLSCDVLSTKDNIRRPLTPIRKSVGEYFVTADFRESFNSGSWELVWKIKETESSRELEVFQEFEVVEDLNGNDMVKSLRALLGDTLDSNFFFELGDKVRKPLDFSWTDEDLLKCLQQALESFNRTPPITGITFETLPHINSSIRTVMLLKAASFAMGVCDSDEITYPISGMSLGQEKIDKYKASEENFIAEYIKLLDDSKSLILEFFEGS